MSSVPSYRYGVPTRQNRLCPVIEFDAFRFQQPMNVLYYAISQRVKTDSPLVGRFSGACSMKLYIILKFGEHRTDEVSAIPPPPPINYPIRL